MERGFEILHEDTDLLVVNKPAGLVCHPTKADGGSSLISRIRTYLGPDSSPHMANRLDRETSGIVIVAKNPKTAGTLGKIWENDGVFKEYLAIVHGRVAEESGLIEAPLGKDPNSQVAIKNRVRADGVSARTRFTVVDRTSRDGRDFSLIGSSRRPDANTKSGFIWPITGTQSWVTSCMEGTSTFILGL